MATRQKPAYRPRVGDRRWIVEWTYELAWVDGDDSSEYREIDRDNCKERCRMVLTREDAERVAREVWPQTHNAFGVVQYGEAEFVAYDENDAAMYPHVGYWEAINEYGEVYEGDE